MQNLRLRLSPPPGPTGRFRPPNGPVGRWLLSLLVAVSLAASLAGAPGAIAPDSAAQSDEDDDRRPLKLPARGEPLDDETLEQLVELHHQEQEQVRLVLLPTVVSTKKGRPVPGLVADDFRIFEDTVPQEVRYFGAEMEQSISIAFLLDLSGSMRQIGKLDEAKAAIRFFAENLKPDDRLALIGFAGERVDWITRFTSDQQRFLERLDVQRAYGSTALYSAIGAVPELVDRETRGRKAIILFTDGVDNASTINTFKATRLARKVEVPIYAIGFTSLSPKIRAPGSEGSIMSILRLFTEETGGALYSVFQTQDLKRAILEIQRDLRFQYVLGYHPIGNRWDGGFRRIKIETTRGKYEVRTRRGYYAEP